LARLRAALGGDTQIMLMVGNADVGKTRFAGEGMRRAAAGGVGWGWGGGLPPAGEVPPLAGAGAGGGAGRPESGGRCGGALGWRAGGGGEVVRLLPGLGPYRAGARGRGERWRRERLFSAVAELLGAAARRSGLGLVVEDVHWADAATLDCLTYLARAGRGAMSLVVTCRGDEAPLARPVVEWLAALRRGGGGGGVRRGPVCRGEGGERGAGLGGRPSHAGVAACQYR